MSNLDPTPQTDKNGVTGFPGYSDEQLADAFGLGIQDEPQSRDVNLQVVQAMREANPSIVKIALKLLDAGSEAGAAAVRKRLGTAANSIRMYFLHPDSYPSVKSVLRYAWKADTKREMVREWSQAAVTAELDPAFASEPDYVYGSAVNTLNRHISGNGKHPLETEYWRGLYLLHFAGVDVDNNGNFSGVANAEEAVSMAQWLNEHEDPNLAVTVARELRIYDPKVLGDLISAGHHKSAVRDGFI
jgi:hypothetical protein